MNIVKSSIPDPDPVGSETIWLHGSGSVIGWFPGLESGSEIIIYGSYPSNFELKQ